VESRPISSAVDGFLNRIDGFDGPIPHQFAFELLEKAGVGVAPGVDFGQAGKRAVRFSYALRGTARSIGE
jgi:aspartate/methionine/tyrosine aminotransferase